MTALAWLSLTAASGILFALTVRWALDDLKRSRRRRRPRAYPGCVACLAAWHDDAEDVSSNSLELHQMAEHTGGPRW